MAVDEEDLPPANARPILNATSRRTRQRNGPSNYNEQAIMAQLFPQEMMSDLDAPEEEL
jgi:hypothetical protein